MEILKCANSQSYTKCRTLLASLKSSWKNYARANYTTLRT